MITKRRVSRFFFREKIESIFVMKKILLRQNIYRKIFQTNENFFNFSEYFSRSNDILNVFENEI